jgi:dCMP deaminase
MDWAERVAQLSHARRLKIGALIVKDNHVHYGYNGMPEGWDNNCENLIGYHQGEPVLKTKPEVLHAESNAIAKLAKSNESADGADLFVTYSPCLDCAKLILQSGIRRVWFKNQYRDSYGIEFLKKSGVEVHHYDNTKV